MYWYVSPAKVNGLSQARRSGALRAISLKVRAPFVEAQTDLQFDAAEVQNKLRKLRARLESDPSIRAFENLADAPPPLFSFSGRAAKVIKAEAVLVADGAGSTALLLAGSASNVVGTPPPPAQHMSASLDPLSGIYAMFAESPDPQSVASAVSFGWQAVVRQTLGVILPEVAGIAILAGIVPSVKAQMRRAGGGDLTRIVVGSPVYIEQK